MTSPCEFCIDFASNARTHFRSWSTSPHDFSDYDFGPICLSDICDGEDAALLRSTSQELEAMLAESLKLEDDAFGKPRPRSTPPVFLPPDRPPCRVVPLFFRLASASGLEEEEEKKLNEEVAHFMARYSRALDRIRTPSRHRPRNPMAMYLVRRRRGRPQSAEMRRSAGPTGAGGGHKCGHRPASHQTLLWPLRRSHTEEEGRRAPSLACGESPLDRLHFHLMELPQFRHRPELSLPAPLPASHRKSELEEEVELSQFELPSKSFPSDASPGALWLPSDEGGGGGGGGGSRSFLFPSVTSAFEPAASVLQP